MGNIISMQDIRTSLASLADRAQAGETFVVIRNSRPVFRILPPEDADSAPRKRQPVKIADLTERIDQSGAADTVTEGDLDAIIHEVHGRKIVG